MLKSEGNDFIIMNFDISVVRTQGITFKMQFYNAEDLYISVVRTQGIIFTMQFYHAKDLAINIVKLVLGGHISDKETVAL